MERFIQIEIFRKKVIPFEVLPFSRFYRNDGNFLYHLFGLLVRGFMSKESEKFSPVFCFSVPKKIPVPFHGNFSPRFPYKW